MVIGGRWEDNRRITSYIGLIGLARESSRWHRRDLRHTSRAIPKSFQHRRRIPHIYTTPPVPTHLPHPTPRWTLCSPYPVLGLFVVVRHRREGLNRIDDEVAGLDVHGGVVVRLPLFNGRVGVGGLGDLRLPDVTLPCARWLRGGGLCVCGLGARHLGLGRRRERSLGLRWLAACRLAACRLAACRRAVCQLAACRLATGWLTVDGRTIPVLVARDLPTRGLPTRGLPTRRLGAYRGNLVEECTRTPPAC